MKKEMTAMGICAVAMLAVQAWLPYGPLSKFLVVLICAVVMWAFVSAFNKA